jgi:hypothetical protein
MSVILPDLATLAEFRAARREQRSRPFLWFKPTADGRWWCVRLTLEQAATVTSGCIMRLCRHELAARAALDLWDAEIASPPTALINGAAFRSAKLLHAVTHQA